MKIILSYICLTLGVLVIISSFLKQDYTSTILGIMISYNFFLDICATMFFEKTQREAQPQEIKSIKKPIFWICDAKSNNYYVIKADSYEEAVDKRDKNNLVGEITMLEDKNYL